MGWWTKNVQQRLLSANCHSSPEVHHFSTCLHRVSVAQWRRCRLQCTRGCTPADLKRWDFGGLIFLEVVFLVDSFVISSGTRYVPYSCFLVCFAAFSAIVNCAPSSTWAGATKPLSCTYSKQCLCSCRLRCWFRDWTASRASLWSCVNGMVKYQIRKLEVYAELAKFDMSRKTSKVAVTSRDRSMISTLVRKVLGEKIVLLQPGQARCVDDHFIVIKRWGVSLRCWQEGRGRALRRCHFGRYDRRVWIEWACGMGRDGARECKSQHVCVSNSRPLPADARARKLSVNKNFDENAVILFESIKSVLNQLWNGSTTHDDEDCVPPALRVANGFPLPQNILQEICCSKKYITRV